MAIAQTHSRTCPHCKGKYFLGSKTEKPTVIIPYLLSFKGKTTIFVCDHCDKGIQKPKEVIYQPDKFEPIKRY